MADDSELRIVISAFVEDAVKHVEEMQGEVGKMAESFQVDGRVAAEAIDSVKRSIDELKVDMDGMRGAVAKVHIDDTQAIAAVDDVKLKIAEMKEQTKMESAKLRVEAETARADADIEAFKALLDTLPKDKRVRVNVEKRTVEVGNDFGVPGGAPAGGGSLGGLIASMLPMVSPLGAAGIGGGMGLISAFAPGLLGTAGMAAVAHANISPITTAVGTVNKDVQAAFNGLNLAQMNAGNSLLQFESYWKSFARSFQKPILAMFTDSLNMLQNLLQDMRPAIAGASKAFGTLFKAASQALNSPFWKNFFSFIGKQAQPSILAFGKTVGNLAKGFAGLLVAFQPMAKIMETGMVNLSKDFAKWGASLKNTKQFESFLKYAQQSGHTVVSLIKNLATIVGTLLKDVGPLGLAMLQLVNTFAKFVSELITTNPLFVTLISAITRGATEIVKFATNLMQNHRNLVTLAADIGVGALAYLAFSKALVTTTGSVKKLVTGFKSMMKFVTELPTRIGLMTLKVKEAYKATVSFTKATVKNGLAIVRTTFNIVKQTARIIAQTVAWTAQKVAMGTWLVISKLVTAAQWAWNAAMDANPIGAVIALIVALGAAAYELIKHWSSVKKFFVNMWDDVKSAFQAFGNWVESWVSRIFGSVTNVINHVKSAIQSVAHFLGVGGGSSSASTAAVSSRSPVTSAAGGGVTIHNHINVQGHVLHEKELTDIVSRGQYNAMVMQGKFST